MKAKTLLRIAAIFMLLHTIGHTFGALGWKDAPNESVKKVIGGMISIHFNFMGRFASIADFYVGYGYTMIGVLLMISITLWLLSNDTVSPISRKFQMLLSLFLLFLAVIEYIYFFLFAAALTLLAGVCTAFSLKNNNYGSAKLS